MPKINNKDILIAVHVPVKVRVLSVIRMRIRATNLILNKLHNLLLARLLLSRPVMWVLETRVLRRVEIILGKRRVALDMKNSSIKTKM